MSKVFDQTLDGCGLSFGKHRPEISVGEQFYITITNEGHKMTLVGECRWISRNDEGIWNAGFRFIHDVAAQVN